MGLGQGPRDDNKVPAILGYDPVTHQLMALQVASPTTDPTTGITYGVLQSNASFSASSVAVNDGTTPANKLAVDGTGKIGLNNFPSNLGVSQQATASTSATLQNAQAGNANGTPLNVLGMAAAVITVNMTGFTGTVNFEGQEDGTNFKALNAVLVGTNTITQTAVGAATTSIALYEIPVAGLQQIQARTSGVSAGTVTVTGHAVPLPYNGKVVNANQVNGPWSVSASGNFNNASVGTDGSAIPSNSTLLGASDGTNLQQLLVESASQRNLRTGLYNGANEAAVDALGNQQVKGGFTEQASLSAGTLNADLVPSVDVSAYKWFSVHITGAWVGTISFQASNDNVNFQSIIIDNISSVASLPSTATSGGIFHGMVTYRYLRVRMTSYTSGTANGVLELYTTPGALSVIGAIQASSWTVQPGNTANTTAWLMHPDTEGQSTTAIAAATAANTVVKASAGRLCRVLITATGTAEMDIFDNASTNSGTKIGAIPANPTIGQVFDLRMPATNGITVGGSSNNPGVTISWT